MATRWICAVYCPVLFHHIKPPSHQVQAGSLRDGAILVFVCSFVAWNTFRAMVSIDD